MAGAPSRLLFLIHRRPLSLFRSSLRHSLTTLSATTNHHLLRLTSFTPFKFSQSFYSSPTSFAFPVNYYNPADGNHVQPSHPWPEWFRLLECLSHAGYFNGNRNIEDEFAANVNLPTEFANAANSCFAFARHRPDILGWLPRKDIQVVIENGYPFLFKSGQETERRMRSFVQAVGFNEATLVDLMKYILSYASNPIIYPERTVREATESSVRNLLQEMANVSERGPEQMPRNFGPNITMKKGDWICSKCNFMNFARNIQCLECEELRPQRQLSGGDWDCPRCNFFNYRKNVACLKCECSRPTETPLAGGYTSSNNSEISTSYVQSSRIQDTEKEERTERWFKKVKELHGVTDQTNSTSNDNFPRIMPSRKEETPFLDNTSKDHRSSPYQGSTSNFVPFPPGYFANKNVQQQPKSIDSAAKQISGNFYSDNVIFDKNIMRGTGNQQMGSTKNMDSRSFNDDRTLFRGETNTHISSNQFRRNESFPEGNRSIFSEDMNTDPSNDRSRRNEPTPEGNRTLFSGDLNTNSCGNQFRRNQPYPDGNRTMFSGDMNTLSSNDPFKRNESKPEGNRTTYSGNMNAFSSSNQFRRNEPFPSNDQSRRNEPTPEGNRTLFSGDLNTNSCGNQFRRNEPYPEGNRTMFSGDMNTLSSNDPFKRNESKPEGNRITYSGDMNAFSSRNQFTRNEPMPGGNRTMFGGDMNSSNDQFRRNEPKPEGNPTIFSGDMNTDLSRNQFRRNEPMSEGNTALFSGDMNNSPLSNRFRRNEPMPEGDRILINGDMKTDSSSNQFRSNEPRTEIRQQTPESMNVRSGWTGKSLEGSAVTEPDPLDMSEEAKAERWFRRVAQIKDISELSQIPDEDFPSIMPMRKGVNRFVVSKRKTPLERRLTSPQYRKNLRSMSFDPTKNEGNDDN